MEPGSIVLTMIVKDEEHVIIRALESCYKFIDTYCIVDTGSTDKTKELIKDFFDEKGIDGKIVDFKFTNFEDCRNMTIKHGRELGEYGFWLDADEQLQLNDKFDKELFSKSISRRKVDQMTFLAHYEGMKYNRIQFFRFDADFFWYGPIHEILRTNRTDLKADHFKYGNVFITPDGNSWKGDVSKKYEDHATVLLNYQIANNWNDNRWTFYLAQSYRDAYQIAEEMEPGTERAQQFALNSLKYYQQRAADMNGYFEEVYFSQLMIARISKNIYGADRALAEYMRCDNINIYNRIEHFYDIMELLLQSSMPGTAVIYGEAALTKIRQGSNATLFLQYTRYEWEIDYLYGIALARMNRPKDAKLVFNRILTNRVKAKDLASANLMRKEIEIVEQALKK